MFFVFPTLIEENFFCHIDNVRLTDVFDDICFIRDLRWGIKNGYLSRIRGLQIEADYDMDRVDRRMGDFTTRGLDEEMHNSNNATVVAKAYLEHCLRDDLQTLIYCPTVKICKEVAQAIKSSVPRNKEHTIEVLSEKTGKEKRKEIIENYKDGKIHCIVNCMILTEGTDLPDTRVIINNRPSSNSSLYQQIIGRGTRLAEGKEYCLIIDVVGRNSGYKEICTAPTLFGIEPDRLPKETRKELEEEDLLDFSEALSQQSAIAVKNMVLKQHFIDIFTQERIAIIKEGTKGGYKEIEKLYQESVRKKVEKDQKRYDFGDIVYKELPYEDHFYRVDATYSGRIYFSKPDMLDNTVLDVCIDDVEIRGCPLSFISSEMQMTDAIAFVHSLLQYVVPETYQIVWSKNAKKRMENLDITNKQKWRVEKDFSKYGIKASAKGLTRLQAHNLIDLSCDIKEMEIQKKEITKEYEDAKVPRKGKILERWENKRQSKVLEKLMSEQERKKNFLMFKKEIERIERLKKKKINALRKKEKELSKGPQYFELSMNYAYYTETKEPSDGQKNFLCNLLRDLYASGVAFDMPLELEKLDLDMWHTGFLINYLLYISNNEKKFEKHYVKYYISEYLNRIKDIHDQDGPKTITCKYSLEVYDAGSEAADGAGTDFGGA